MKRSFISIILIAFAIPCAAQWKNAYKAEPILAFGVHDGSLFISIDPASTPDALIWRLGSLSPNVVWVISDTGIDHTQGNVTSFASLGRYFFASTSNGPAYQSTNNGSQWSDANVGGPICSNGKYLFGTYVNPSEIVRSRDSS